MQKASHIFKVQQCHFPNHILRTFHSDPRLRSMSNYFSFFCFASRRKLALPCPGHINRVPNCGEMLPSFKTQSHNFFTNSLHLALKLACLRFERTRKTGGPARPGPANSRPGPAHGQNSKNPARPMGRWGGPDIKGWPLKKPGRAGIFHLGPGRPSGRASRAASRRSARPDPWADGPLTF